VKKKRKGNTQKETAKHPIECEIKGIAFLVLAAVLAGSLFSYHPSDKLIWNVSGPLGQTKNLFGTIGAHISGGIFLVLGFSSFWLVLFALGLALLSFKGKSLESPLRVMLTALVLLLSSSALLALKFPRAVIFKGTEIMAGGMCGLYLSDLSQKLLNQFGAYVLVGAIFIISLMLLTHLSLSWLLSFAWTWISRPYKGIATAMEKRRVRKERSHKTQEKIKKIKSRPKVKVVEPQISSPKEPEQISFPFMRSSDGFTLPELNLLEDPPETEPMEIQRESLEMNARRLEKKLADFGVEGEVSEILPGPVITMYEFKPAPGVKISKVAGLADDLALALRAPSIRIVAPIPGKAAIGIEIPNNRRETVYLKEVLSSPVYKQGPHKLPIALGKDITGSPVVTDLSKMPHLLVAGATGAGKSVSLNAMINSILFNATPDKVRFLLIDPKRIELSVYHDIPHLLHPVVTQPKEATKALRWAVEEMERRYMLLSDRGFRNIDTYNKAVMKREVALREEGQGEDNFLPYVIVVIDELADLMISSSREVEESVTRLAQMARAAGIHLIIATQRPSVDVITGIIKANFPARISFQVTSKVDSRTILDTTGAENLLGEGDMLFLPPGVSRVMRIHGAYISEEEIERVATFLRKQQRPQYEASIISKVSETEEDEEMEMERDEKYMEAVEVVLKTGQASISMLQRKLRVGYNRAARMIELMEKEGIVGPSDGVRPREVYGRRDV